MRILHADTDDIENPLRGGQPVRTFEVNTRLSAQHDITIFTSTYPGSRRTIERGSLHYRRLGLTVPGLGLSPHLSFLASLGFAVRATPHDLVVEEFTPPIGFCLLPWWTKKPVVSIVQWFFFKDWERRYKLPFERIMRSIPSRAPYRNFIVQTHLMGDYFRSLIPGARIWKVPCGVGSDMFQKSVTDGDYVLFLGRLDVNHKGLDLLMESWSKLAVGGKRIPLYLAGAGPADETLRRHITAKGLDDVVKLLGRVEGDRKKALLRNCRFMVMPSRQETFGISALEAMAASKPVVAFDIDHLNEVLDSKWAILTRPLDAAGFADAVAKLWSEPGRCRQLGEKAFVAAQSHKWDEIARVQEEIYEQIAGMGRSS
jgi:glycosyltransferase involved in cell wall biosynthesis